ncbi:MAG: hypothetical protein AAGJ97_10780 [Planctomycetota bacterium]
MSSPQTAQTAVSRPLLRYLTSSHGLGPGSRVAVCGGDAAAMTAALRSLGLETDTADTRPLDAVIWIETDKCPPSDRSSAACDTLLGRLRDGGSVISVVDRDAEEPAITSGAPSHTVPLRSGLASWFGRDGYSVRTLTPTDGSGTV